jgi:hypothetical protein
MRTAWRAVIAVAVLLIAAAITCAAVAIWTTGPDAGRWGGTAGLLGFVGLCLGMSSVIGMEE